MGATCNHSCHYLITAVLLPAAPAMPDRAAYRSVPMAPVAPVAVPAARSRSPPLPSGWAKAWTPSGELYFIDHTTQTSHWDDPRRSTVQLKGGRDPLPHGRSDPSRGPRAPALHFEEQRRKEQELVAYQRRELEAEKARLAMGSFSFF